MDGEDGATDNLLRDIRHNFPESKIILSTWQGQAKTKAKPDTLIESIDPGGILTYPALGVMNNINRQITSTLAGLRCVETSYCVKIRSDLRILNSNLLKLLNSSILNVTVNSDISLFFRRVIFSNEFFINPRGKLKVAHHPCDWIQVGHRDDLAAIWSVPLASEHDMLFWVGKEKPKDFPFIYSLSRYSAEEWIWVNFLIKSLKFNYSYSGDNLEENIKIQEGLIKDQLIIANRKILGFDSEKYPVKRQMIHVAYSFLDWARISKNLTNLKVLSLISFEDFRVVFWRFAYPSLILSGHYYRLASNSMIRILLLVRSKVREIMGV